MIIVADNIKSNLFHFSIIKDIGNKKIAVTSTNSQKKEGLNNYLKPPLSFSKGISIRPHLKVPLLHHHPPHLRLVPRPPLRLHLQRNRKLGIIVLRLA